MQTRISLYANTLPCTGSLTCHNIVNNMDVRPDKQGSHELQERSTPHARPRSILHRIFPAQHECKAVSEDFALGIVHDHSFATAIACMH